MALGLGLFETRQERERAEAGWALSERSLQLTIDAIPTLAWSARADGSADYFNQHYLDFVGLTSAQLSGWQWTDAIHPDDLDMLIRAWAGFRESGTGGEAEARVRRHDGTYRCLLFRASPLCDDEGRVVRWYGVNIDIEEQKRVTLMLAGERQLLEMIAFGRPLRDVLRALCRLVEEAAPGCHCDIRPIDDHGRRFDYSVSESLPPSYAVPFAGAPLFGEHSPCGLAVAQGAQVIAEDVARDPRWMGASVQDHLLTHGLRAVWSTPVQSKEGAPLGTLCIYRRAPALPQPSEQDVIDRASHIASIAIERLRAEDELRRSAHYLAAGERVSLTGSFAWRLDSDRISFSDQLRRIHEFDADETITPERFRSRIHPDDLDIIDRAIAAMVAGEGDREDEIRLLMPDGRVKFVRTFLQLVRDEDGGLECIGAVQDVTRRRDAEDMLDRVRSDLAHVTRVMSLGALTASIAHEVSQPLSGIITNASTSLRMLALDPPDVEGAIKTAQRTLRDGNRASEVIARLRTLFSRKDVATEAVDLNEAVREIVMLSMSDMHRRGVTVRTMLAPGLALVAGDRVQLQQVILNLLLNAADAMAAVAGGVREIRLETMAAPSGHAQLTVRDSGPGITDEERGRIFQPFYTTKANGMGIGLSVSRTILDRHGGMLWAMNNEGPGAAFAFTVPFAPDPS